MAKVFKTHKNVNNWCKCEHVSVGVFSSKLCERSERQVLKFLTQALGEVAQYQLVKSDFLQENIAYIYSVEQLKNNGFSFTTIGNLCLIYYFLTTYLNTK
jgi:hypothetical protein